MHIGTNKLGTKLYLALLATAVFALGAFTLVAWPVLQGAIREDRIKLFVEQYTRALAENVSHALNLYQTRVRGTASTLALMRISPAGNGHGDQERLLNHAAQEPVAGGPAYGMFDLLVVVGREGKILYCNSQDRFGRQLDARRLIGRSISAFPEEERAWRAALRSAGKVDWYRSPLVEAVRSTAEIQDLARGYAIAFAEPIGEKEQVLIGIVNWESIQRILDQAAGPLAQIGFPSGYAFMFASDADTIIAHKLREPHGASNYGKRLVADVGLPQLSSAVKAGWTSLRYEYPAGIGKVSGLARIDDSDFGWTVGLGINDADVVAPLTDLGWKLALVASAAVLLSLGMAHYFSGSLTWGLRQLTHSAQRIADGFLGESVAVRSQDEVGRLAEAFNQMTSALVRRDEVILQQQQGVMERIRLEQEVRIAAEVQKRLFPQLRPPLRTLDYSGFCQPVHEVGGDYYDFVPMPPSKLGVLVADVSGKGLSAALLMASLHACARTHGPLMGERCGELVATINSLLYETTESNRYATLFYAVYDDVTRRLTYVSAGHHPALLLRASGEGNTVARVSAAQVGSAASAEHSAESAAVPVCEWLSFGTAPAGLFETIPAVQQTVQLAPGDWLVIYSDGLSEADDGRGNEFGIERLAEAVQQHRGASVAGMEEAILADFRRYTGSRPLADDLTLIVARIV